MTPPQQYVIEHAQTAAQRAAVPTRRAVPAAALSLIGDAVALAGLGLAAGYVTGIVQPHVLLFGLLVLIGGLPALWAGPRLNVSALDDLAPAAKRIALAYAAVAAVVTLFPSGDGRVLLGSAVAALPAVFTGRFVTGHLTRRLARAGALRKAVVVGADMDSMRIMQATVADPDYGLDVVAAIPALSRHEAPPEVRRLGTLDDLGDIVASRSAEVVVVASDVEEKPELIASIRSLLAQGIDVFVVPRFSQIGSEASSQHVGSVPLVRLLPPAQERFGWGMKRVIDMAVSAMAIVVASPVLLAIALAVKIDSRGPVLFKQERVGLDGTSVEVWKFRTMAPCSELRSQTEWAADSHRVTRVGKILRDTGLDEVPQLFNVLFGTLSLVGPRPERPVFVKMFEEMYPHYTLRHRVPVGITGWAQVHGLRGDTSISDRASFDNYYIETWSLWRDLKIALLTLRTVLPRYRGATMGASETSAVEGPQVEDTNDKVAS